MKQYTSSAHWPREDPKKALAGAANVLADYLFTHPDPPCWRALAAAAARGSDEFGFALMAWSSLLKKWEPAQESGSRTPVSLGAAERARLDEWSGIYQALGAQLDEAGQRLLHRVDELRGAALADECDRVLAIAGRLCLQIEEPDLFRRIYAAALDGCLVNAGDEMRFLYRARMEAAR